MISPMSDLFGVFGAALLPATRLIRARAKVLAREDRLMRSELVRIRRQNDLTQKDVADALGVSPQAVQKLERYDADPKLSTLRKYANAVGALIEHHVVADVGQSVTLANASSWESIATPGAQAVMWRTSAEPARTGKMTFVRDEDWSDARRSHFALGA